MQYVDRIKDIINRGGIKISAAEVESYLVRTQKWPEVLHGVTEFPTTTGKVGKVELREQARTKASEDGTQVDIPQTT